MKKCCKILFLFILIIMLTFACSINVNADVDAEGYEIIEDMETPETTPTEKTPATTKEPTTMADTSASPKPHVQAGQFEVAKYSVSFLVITGVSVLVYARVKKYNY